MQETNVSKGVVVIGADHGGFELKESLKPWLEEQGWTVRDVGANSQNPDDDYPDMALAAAEQVVSAEDDQRSLVKGILLCRSGGGMAIAANKVAGIRALPVYTAEQAQHAVEHDHVQIISLAGDWIEPGKAKEIVAAFLDAKPSLEERHVRRVAKIAKIVKSI